MHVRLDRVQHLRLEQQPGQAEPLDGVFLHDLNHADREERADVAEPAGDAGSGRAEPGVPLRGTLLTGTLLAETRAAEPGRPGLPSES